MMPYEPMVVVPDTYRGIDNDREHGSVAMLVDNFGETVRLVQANETVIVLPTSDADTLIMVQAWFWMLRKMESAEVAK
uniref:Uncharacterized protein n=2 Tax=viral metagenome TaxID=1070528 RepID=A0A6M3KMF1_9ZZZZ